jgi:tRNA pseudouridine38-40 synthase
MHGQNINLTGSGRTDAGVHAIGQAANFYTNIDGIPCGKFVPALNSLLPQDVRITESCEEKKEFHARFSALSRTYRYRFLLRTPLPHESRYVLKLSRPPDIQTLNAYGRLLLGETDCSIFCGADDSACSAEGKSKNRYIYSSYFYAQGDLLVFEIRANAFLRNMVRSVAGTFLHYEEKGASVEEMRRIIASGERGLAGPTLPPQGLFLSKVEY